MDGLRLLLWEKKHKNMLYTTWWDIVSLEQLMQSYVYTT